MQHASTVMGPDSVNVNEQFTFSEDTDDTKKTLDNVIKMFDNHFEPVKNTIFERAKFNSMVQGELSIHQFIVQLQEQAGYCEYGAMKDKLIRDRIVVGVSDKKLRDYLIDIDDLDLNKCIQKSKQYVAHHKQACQFDRVGSENLDAVRKYSNNKSYRGQQSQRSGSGDKVSTEKSSSSKPPCEKCGKSVH